MDGAPLMTVRRSLFAHRPFATAGLALLAPLTVGISLLALLAWWALFRSTLIRVFRTHCEYESGLFSKHHSRIDIKDIRNIQLKQSLIQRILNMGDVGISTSGQSGFEIEMEGVSRAKQLKKLIEQLKTGVDVAPVADLPFEAGPAFGVGASCFAGIFGFVIVYFMFWAGKKGLEAANAGAEIVGQKIEQVQENQRIEDAKRRAMPHQPVENKVTPAVEQNPQNRDPAQVTPVESVATTPKETVLPEKSEPDTQNSRLETTEKEAASKLTLAKQLLKTNKSAAERRLKEVVEKYPGTNAALESEQLLKGLTQ